MHKKLSNLLRINIAIIFVMMVNLDFTKIKIFGMSQKFIQNKNMLIVFLIAAYLYLIIRAIHEYHTKKEDGEFINDPILEDVKDRLKKETLSVIKKEINGELMKLQSLKLIVKKSGENRDYKIRDFMKEKNRNMEYSLYNMDGVLLKKAYMFTFLMMFRLIIKSRWQSLKGSTIVLDYYLTTFTTIVCTPWLIYKLCVYVC